MAIPSADFVSSPRGYAPILSIYLAKRFTVAVLLTLIGLAIFTYLVDSVELLRRVSDKGVPALTAMSMGLLKLPSLMQSMLYFAILLATLFYLYGLNRNAELIALRAAGLPARRFVLPALTVVVALGLTTLLVLNPVSATMLKRYERWEATIFPGTAQGLVTPGGSIWLKQNETDPGEKTAHEIFIYGDKISADGTTLTPATVFLFDAKTGSFQMRLDATVMKLKPGQWHMDSVFISRPTNMETNENISPDKLSFEPSLTLPTTLTARMLQNSFNPPGTLGVWELRDFIKTLKQAGFPTAEHEMMYQRTLALPALLVAMFILAVPLALRYGRNIGLGSIMGAGLGLGFAFYIFTDYVATFGLAGRLDVALAAWVPTAIASLLGMALMLQLREE